MAETTWTEEGPGVPKKKGIPTWLWFCGGGCLLAVLVTVVVGGFLFRAARTAMDPEIQKQRLAKILPYDEWPKEMQPMFGMQVVGEQYTFQDTRGFQEQIQLHKGRDGTEGRKHLFQTVPPKFPKNLVIMKFEDLAPGTVEVQGRTLSLLRMRMEFSGLFGKMMPAEAREQMGSTAFIDLTPETLDGMMLFQLTRTKGQAPITDDEIRTVLAPFHVGPKR